MYETILFDEAGGVATVTLNRPERMNAYTPRMGDEIVDAFRRIREDEKIRVALLTGAGRGFCGGVDLEVLKQSRSGGSGDAARLGQEAFLREFPLELAAFPKPVIAAINGPAIGVGVTMVLPCDVRLAAESATLGLTFAKLGILPGLGSTHLLPRLVGPARARELVLTGRIVSAAEAGACGLVSRVCPDAELLSDAREMATEMAAYRPEVIAAAKRALAFGETHDMAEALRNEAEESAALRAGR